MSKYSWGDETNKQISQNCIRCHFKDKDPDICHAVDPPLTKDDELMEILNTVDCWVCGFVPESQWDRIPQEQKDRINKDVKTRSERYYRKRT